MRISFTTLPGSGTEVDVKNVIIRQDNTKNPVSDSCLKRKNWLDYMYTVHFIKPWLGVELWHGRGRDYKNCHTQQCRDTRVEEMMPSMEEIMSRKQ
jgi:hypothetical protein